MRLIYLCILEAAVALTASAMPVTFEVDRNSKEALEAMRQEASNLKKEGLSCYIVTEKDEYALRCNDVSTPEKMAETIRLLKEKGIRYRIVDLGFDHKRKTRKKYKKYKKSITGREKKEKKDPPFDIGYDAYKAGDFQKAYRIFHLYNRKEPSAKHAYAEALALMKMGKYQKAIETLRPWKKEKKAAKLIRSVALGWMYDELKKGRTDKAHRIVKRYLNDSRKYHTEIDRYVLDRLLKSGHYNVAKLFMQEHPELKKSARVAEIDYARAVKLNQKGRYSESNEILKSYLHRSSKAKKLYIANLMSQAGKLDKAGKTDAAIQMLTPYQDDPKVASYLGELQYNRLIRAAWRQLKDRQYTRAYRTFEKAARYNPSAIDPIEGKIQALFQLGLYDRALRLAEDLYERTGRQSAAKMAFLSAYRLDDMPRARYYYRLVGDKEGLPDPYLSDWLDTVDGYIADGDYRRAERVLRRLYAKNPDNVQILQRLYDIAVARRHYGQADRYAREIIALGDAATKGGMWAKIAELYNRRNRPEAVTAYRRAVSYNPEDYGLRQALLYALMKYGHDDAFQKELEKVRRHFPQKRDELDNMELAWLKQRIHQAYQSKDYRQCNRMGQMLSTDILDRGTARLLAWCAYKSEDFDTAKRRFAAINYHFGESFDDIYGFALSAYRQGDEKTALASLQYIHDKDNERYASLISSLYRSIHDATAAKKLVLRLQDDKAREKALINVNKSFTHAFAEHAMSGGFYYRARTGEPGKDKLHITSLPLTYHYTNDRDLHLYAEGDFMNLDNSPIETPWGFGFNNTTADADRHLYDNLFQPNIGLHYKFLRAEIGTTPIGADISPELTGLIRGEWGSDPWKFYLQGSQKSIEESMVSYVGDRAYKDVPQSEWGRVLKRGISAGIMYDSDITWLLELFYAPDIYGEHVVDNSEEKVYLSATYHFPVESISYLDVGIVNIFDSYDKNTLAYTYGNGGYFSPQHYYLGALTFRLGDILDRFYYQLMGGIGYETFDSDPITVYPLASDSPTVPGTSHSGISYKGVAEVGYSLSDNLDIVGAFSSDNVQNYHDNRAGLSLIYRFNEKPYRTFNTFNLNHRIETFMK